MKSMAVSPFGISHGNHGNREEFTHGKTSTRHRDDRRHPDFSVLCAHCPWCLRRLRYESVADLDLSGDLCRDQRTAALFGLQKEEEIGLSAQHNKERGGVEQKSHWVFPAGKASGGAFIAGRSKLSKDGLMGTVLD